MKCFLGLFALGDVGVGADDTNGIALFITYGSSARHYPTCGAIFVQHAMFVNKLGGFPIPKCFKLIFQLEYREREIEG